MSEKAFDEVLIDGLKANNYIGFECNKSALICDIIWLKNHKLCDQTTRECNGCKPVGKAVKKPKNKPNQEEYSLGYGDLRFTMQPNSKNKGRFIFTTCFEKEKPSKVIIIGAIDEISTHSIKKPKKYYFKQEYMRFTIFNPQCEQEISYISPKDMVLETSKKIQKIVDALNKAEGLE
jgi:hypothetical protein